MKLSTRFAIVLTAVTLIPVTVLGFGSAQVSQTYVGQNMADLQATTADGISIYVDTWLYAELKTLQNQSGSLVIENAELDMLSAFGQLLIRQNPNIDALAVLRNDDTPVIPMFSNDETRKILFNTALKDLQFSPPSLSIGVPFVNQDEIFLPLRIPSQTDQFHVAVLLSLKPLKETLLKREYGGLSVALYDSEDRLLLTSDEELTAGLSNVLESLHGGDGFSDIRTETESGLQLIAASSPVSRFGWRVAVVSSAELVERPARDITQRTAFIAIVTLLSAGLLGSIFLQPITYNLKELSKAAQELMLGRYEHQVPLSGDDELQHFAQTFNQMSAALRHFQQEILRKNKTIQEANEVLQQRVEIRTKALQDAQHQLIQSARLAAVGEMGAGMAHALNNPIASIIGMTQILNGKEVHPLAVSILEEARRCRGIITQWKNIQSQSNHNEQQKETSCDLHILLQDASESALPFLQQRQLGVELKLNTDPVWIICEPSSLSSAFVQLLFALRPHLPVGGLLTITLVKTEEQAEVTFSHPRYDVSTDEYNAAAMYYWSAVQQFASQNITLSEDEDNEFKFWRVIIPLPTEPQPHV
ncbi:MAG: histidine kinase dimerization/phospho-acceptor domain-containing protein [Myxococcota bacterium]|nr:histidine kinase dimerization/phospho-acceptor domain-containing protein [Myxococcota bacterium]